MALFGPTASSHGPAGGDYDDLFPSLHDEPPEWLLELDGDPEKLFEYFAEQPSTKQLFATSGALQQSNYESARRNMELKEHLDEMKRELDHRLQSLEKTREELQTMSLLCDEQHQTLSLHSVLSAIEREMDENEQSMAEYKSKQQSKSKIDYHEYAGRIEAFSRRHHLLRFSKEWISENNK